MATQTYQPEMDLLEQRIKQAMASTTADPDLIEYQFLLRTTYLAWADARRRLDIANMEICQLTAAFEGVVYGDKTA